MVEFSNDSLGDIRSRAAREPDWREQSRTLLDLARLQPESRENLIAGVAQAALRLCHAGAAGVSLPERINGEPCFRWHAVAGCFAALQGQTIPAADCPCAATLEAAQPLLFTALLRDFPALAVPCEGVQEALIVPVVREGIKVGALWVASVSDTCRFGPEDERILLDLAQVAGASLEMASARETSRQETRHYSEVIAVLAHEFRNPLGPLENSLEGLSRLTGAQTAQRQLLNIAQRQVQHLKRLMDELQDAARLDHDKLTLNIAEVRLDDVISDALASVREHMSAHRHALEVGPIDAMRFAGDPVRLVQIVSNLLSNAARYTPDGGTIALSVARREDPQGPRLEVVVRDNGIGIDSDSLPRVFEPFSQFAGGRAHQEGGLGIGLGISRKLAQLHDGTLTLSSEGIGRGTVAALSLPLRPPPLAGEAQRGAAERAPVPASHVLIVDDSEDARVALAALLDMDGHHVKTAESGAHALELLAGWTPDLALVDLDMPGMDGLELARRLHAHPERARVTLIALSGRVSEGERQAALDAGFDAHLAKPVDMDRLGALLASAGRALRAPRAGS
ncbi:hybrid sensor histidine kinase/response regulator [Paraburkholderia acidisoli]|uniref:histidine kinase n=1 Tax=Paraburkholderia acidisoli TaxID=2571748 RepID=A0A7Z2GR19_9BURK|nr:hybrid sensor histidine kinase/response regulator [Paraburkholderia acidisoli]QGZ66119.1 response regulator [Paraburkholderia acidisoli]